MTTKRGISCVYVVVALGKTEVKQRFYGIRFNGVQHLPPKENKNLASSIASFILVKPERSPKNCVH